MVLLEIAPGHLALLIGVAELVILAVFRNSLTTASAAHRRWRLHREGRLHFSFAFAQKKQFDMRVTMISSLVFIVTMVSLSIDGHKMRSASRLVDAECYTPLNPPRYRLWLDPMPTQVDDRRFDEYLNQTNCKETLLAQSVSGVYALETGYPHCAPNFGPRKDRMFETECRGCDISSTSTGGFYLHCDVLPVNSRITVKSAVNGTNFFAVLEGGQQSRPTFHLNLPFQPNLRIPKGWHYNGPLEEAVVNCTKGMDPVECYKLLKKKVDETKKARSSSESQLGLYIQVLPNAESTICVFDNEMKSYSEWVSVDQILPDAEEGKSRTGPVLTGFRVWGKARCIERVDKEIPWMHNDALENADVMPDGRHKKFLIPWVQKHVVVMGLSMRTGTTVACQVFRITEGSLLSRAWFITIFGTLLIFLSFVSAIYSCYTNFRCPIEADPLTSQWGFRELLNRKRQFRNAGPEDWSEDIYVGIVEREGVAQYELYDKPDFHDMRNWNLPGP